MKSYLFAIIVLCFLKLSCTKNDDLETATFRVKIIKEICNDAIVQLVDIKSKKYAEDDFNFEGQKLDNVFFTTFSCQDRAKMQTLSNNLSGTVITVRLLNQPKEDPNCARCLATLATRPNKTNYIEVIGQ